LVALAVLLLVSPGLLATSYAPPRRHSVYSPNGSYFLDVDPRAETLTVYATADPKTPLWSFSSPIWHGPFYLSNDGRVAAGLAWVHVRVEDVEDAVAVQFWDRTGEFKSYAMADLCPRPRRPLPFAVGPIGGFWRVWYDQAEQVGDTLRVRTTDRYEYLFSLKDGTMTRRLVWSVVLLRYWPYLSTALLLSLLLFFLWRRARRRRMALSVEAGGVHLDKWGGGTTAPEGVTVPPPSLGLPTAEGRGSACPRRGPPV
jgi:hypothetical protein